MPRINVISDRALASCPPRSTGPSPTMAVEPIAPEHLLKACLLMTLFTARGERQPRICERWT